MIPRGSCARREERMSSARDVVEPSRSSVITWILKPVVERRRALRMSWGSHLAMLRRNGGRDEFLIDEE